jgi:nitrogen fixation NifU-like protein
MSIYIDIILDQYKNPHNKGSLENPTNSIHLKNPLCGDEITLQIKTDNNIVKDIKFDGQGCAISTASASMLTDYAKGKSIDELKKLDTQFILDLIGVELSPNRLKCALLPLEALHKVL